MKPGRLVAATVVAFVAVAIPAYAKGASEVTIKGGGRPISFGGGRGADGDPASGSRLGRFTEASGIFPSLFETYPDPMLDDPPTKRLGYRYTAIWRFPTGGGHNDLITQYLYPFARGGPLTYMPADQTIFDGQPVQGGWYVASPEMTALLRRAGLTPPAAGGSPGTAVGSVAAGSSLGWMWVIVAVIGFGISAYLVRLRIAMAKAR
jgi:hypothetical protein